MTDHITDAAQPASDSDDLVEVVIACCNGQMGRDAAREVISEIHLAGFKIVPAHSSAATGDAVNGLEWRETFADRGDGSTELSGYEAETPFGTFYTIEIKAFAFAVEYDLTVIGEANTPGEARRIAQRDFERRIRTAIRDTQPQTLSEEERHAVEHARYQVQHASPDNPDCHFDYGLVLDLVRAIDRAYALTRPEGK